MNRVIPTTLLMAVVLAVLQGAFPGAHQVFRASEELVAVRVSVRRGGKPVRGLTTADFSVLENGQVRPVLAVDAGKVPVDFALVIEQGSAATLWHGGFAKEIADIPTLLGPEDRLSATFAGEGTEEVVRSDGTRRTPALTMGGAPPLLDAIARELIVPVANSRQRSVLIVCIPGDSASVLDYESVLRLARATPARLDVALASWRTSKGGVEGTRTRQRLLKSALMYHDYDPSRETMLWTNAKANPDTYFERMEDDNRRRFRMVAEATGGRELGWRGGSLRRAVEESLAEIHEGYVLYVRPAPSATPGWHPIQVQVPSQSGLHISARAGYVR